MKIKVYSHLLNPKEYLHYERHPVQPPSWETFDNRTQFVALRGFRMKEGMIVDYQKTLDKYINTNGLCDVIWPSYPFLFAENVKEVVDELRKRDIFLFDIWGYVPGSGEGGYWKQFKPDKDVLELFEEELGERWLGMDVGEQDGRYVLAYVSQMIRPSASRAEQYLNFRRHIQKICDQLGNKMVTLLAITLGHYELKEGGYTLIGAETAQMHPNGQVFYAYLRGAGKQYGVPWFGNASVYNRWGYKTYGMRDITANEEAYDDHGPTKGASLSLLKRLLYSHILYNCVLVGFESGWFESEMLYDEHGIGKQAEGERLSPIGVIQQSARKWLDGHGQPGVMLTQVAVMNDFYSGWTFPNYNHQLYRVWGNRPYEAHDYLTDQILDMFYPGYQNSSFIHDETGFISPTPYGDTVDCLLSDAEQRLIDRYPVLVVAGGLSQDAEVFDKLEQYTQQGGHLVLFAESLEKFPHGFAGVSARTVKSSYEVGTTVQVFGEDITEDYAFELYSLHLPGGANIISKCGDMPAVCRFAYGKGTVTLFASPDGITREAVVESPIRCVIDHPLPRPYPLLKHVRVVLDQIFKSQVLFEVGEDLSLIVCRKGKGQYTLGVCNNTWEERPFKIVSHIGEIQIVRELAIDQLDKECEGYVPEGYEKKDTGASNDVKIAGGDVRIFAVEVEEEGVEEIPHILPVVTQKNCAMTLGDTYSIEKEILTRPTFFDHFDSIVVDWHYLHRSEGHWLASEGQWISRQGLKIIVDLSSGINLYPDVRLVNNDDEEYGKSMAVIEDVIAKMPLIGAKDLILCLHRAPENNFTMKNTLESFIATLRRLCETAEKDGITLYLRTQCTDLNAVHPNSEKGEECDASDFHEMTPDALCHFIECVAKPNLKLAASIALFLTARRPAAEVLKSIKEHVGMWLVAAPEWDIAGRLWSIHSPLVNYKERQDLADIFNEVCNGPVVLDVKYDSWNKVYRDVKLLKMYRGL
ncbi:MAG: hypothetical protein ACQEXQ_02655 [Bacillota bacterium]